MKVRQFNKMAAQGELLLIKVAELPDGLKEVKENHDHIVGHSETGHHHIVARREARFFEGNDPLVCYLQVTAEFADLVHTRSFDTHESVRMDTGTYEIRRQREYSPEGWRQVVD